MIEFFSSHYFLFAVGGILSMFLYEYMQRTFYPRKEWTKDKKFLYFLVYAIDFIIAYALTEIGYPILNLITTIASYMVPLFICFEVKNKRGIAYYVYYLVGSIISEIIISASLGGLRNGMQMETSYELMTPIASITMNLMEIIIILSLCRFGNKEKNNKYDVISQTFMVLPLISVSIMVVDNVLIAYNKIPNFNKIQYVQLGVILLLINVVLFIIMEKYTAALKQEAAICDEKNRIEEDIRLMEIASKSMRDKLAISEQTVQQDRLMRHDRRHFESLILTLIQEGKTEEAEKYLEERLKAEPQAVRKYCDNTTINAAISYYENMAYRKGIKTEISTNIPNELKVDEMELAIVISNLMENAIHACEKLPAEYRTIKIRAKYKNQLLLVVENPYEGEILLDEGGYPCTMEFDHGVGTKSIQYFVKKTESEISYNTENKKFTVRMIINA